MSRQVVKFKPSDEVNLILEGGELGFGRVLRTLEAEGKAVIKMSDGKKVKVKLESLRLDDVGEGPDFDGSGFTQYDVRWDDITVNFRVKNENALFYGWWRKISNTSFAIDVNCKYLGKEYNCDVLYYDRNPRKNIDSLNADICAAVNKWLYCKCKGHIETIKSLEMKATKPTVHFETIESIDRLLIELKDYRDTAIKTGGLYTYIFTGDKAGDPTMGIELRFCRQAKALQGNVPSLYTGAMLDHSADMADGTGKSARRRKDKGDVSKPMSTNIDSILERLKTTTDQAQRRKLRAVLRKMGHRGGTRSKSD
jgi:hypothetical protein